MNAQKALTLAFFPQLPEKSEAFLVLKKRSISLMKNVPQLCRNVSYRRAAVDMSRSSLFTRRVQLKMRQLFVYTAYVTWLRVHLPPPTTVWRLPCRNLFVVWKFVFLPVTSAVIHQSPMAIIHKHNTILKLNYCSLQLLRHLHCKLNSKWALRFNFFYSH
jgi:hypothetical protein